MDGSIVIDASELSDEFETNAQAAEASIDLSLLPQHRQRIATARLG